MTAQDEIRPEPGITWRLAVTSLGRAILTSTALFAVYFLAPLNGHMTVRGLVFLTTGLTAFAVFLSIQVRSVMHARAPWLRAIEVLATAAPFFVLLFSATYYLLARNREGSFSAPLTRLDALYFTVTVFATVGFGDIVARSQLARGIVTAQMFSDLIVLGLGLRVLFGAVRIGMERKADHTRSSTSESPRAQAPEARVEQADGDTSTAPRPHDVSPEMEDAARSGGPHGSDVS